MQEDHQWIFLFYRLYRVIEHRLWVQAHEILRDFTGNGDDFESKVAAHFTGILAELCLGSGGDQGEQDGEAKAREELHGRIGVYWLRPH